MNGCNILRAAKISNEKLIVPEVRPEVGTGRETYRMSAS